MLGRSLNNWRSNTDRRSAPMKMFLAGSWIDKAEKVDVRNPFDCSLVDTVPKADTSRRRKSPRRRRRRRPLNARHARLPAISNPL